MSDEWKDGYQQGFKDGYELGKRWQQPSIPNPLWDNKPYCKVCGIDFSKPMGYVCQHPQCPSRITCSTDRIVENVGHIKKFSNVTTGQFSISDPGPVTDGLSYEEIYGSVIYRENNKKE